MVMHLKVKLSKKRNTLKTLRGVEETEGSDDGPGIIMDHYVIFPPGGNMTGGNMLGNHDDGDVDHADAKIADALSR